MKKLFLAITLVAILLVMTYCSKRDESIKWCSDHEYDYVSYNMHYTCIGTPFFYLNKGQTIHETRYKTASGKSRTLWVRTGWWYDTIIE